jgi:two-component system response regulator AtoC
MLILGERGAGKFAVASLIHSLSVRSGFELRKLQCAETPESVLAGELFGDVAENYDRRTHSGKSAVGEQDTVFLDEITALPASLQKRLAQFLQKDELLNAYADVNSTSIRILAASSVNLDRAVAENRLREDLYYRLSAFTLQVPPLRQRKDEIALLLCYFMHKLAKHYSLPTRGFSAPTVDASRHYNWPGNLKEMETFVKRYLLTGDEQSALQEIGSVVEESARAQISHQVSPQGERHLRTAALPRPLAEQNSYPESLKSLIQGVKSEAEQNAIGAALRRTGWNRKAAARLLRVSYRTLLYKIDQYHMRAPEPYFSTLPIKGFSDLEEVKGSGKAS